MPNDKDKIKMPPIAPSLRGQVEELCQLVLGDNRCVNFDCKKCAFFNEDNFNQFIKECGL